MQLYKTIRQEASEMQLIEKSKFIAHARPVSSREEADSFIAEIKRRYKDATHNVPAMVIGDKFQIQWASDDGEPQGTSGAPIVQMLVKEGITNLAIVVTRYFGGIKLGTGGLVRAYTGTAKLAVEAAGVCSVSEACRLEIEMDYTYLARIQKTAGDIYEIADLQYGEKVTAVIEGDLEDEGRIKNTINNITSGTACILGEERALVKKIGKFI